VVRPDEVEELFLSNFLGCTFVAVLASFETELCWGGENDAVGRFLPKRAGVQQVTLNYYD
jgi:hypothetical protein